MDTSSIFYRQLLDHPEHLEVLGDGNQCKSYLYISDCIAAVLHVMRLQFNARNNGRIEIYNLGTNDYCRVVDSIEWICGELGPSRHRLLYWGSTRLDR